MNEKLNQKAQMLALALDRKDCEKDFAYFYKCAFQILEPNTTFEDSWHVDYLCFILQREFERIQKGIPAKYSDIVVNVPPRTSKSLIFSIIFPAWVWVRNPSFKLITTSYSLDLAHNFSQQSMQLMASEWFQARWPSDETFSLSRSDGGKEAVGYMVNNKGGKRKSSSTGSSLTGFGGLMILQDDPQSPKQAGSAAETEAAINFYKGTLSSRLDNQRIGVIFTIMQRLAENDMSSYILEAHEDKVLHINLPAIADSTERMPHLSIVQKMKPGIVPYPGGILFPGLLDRGVLDRLKMRLGSLDYATQYMQHPYPAEGLIAKREHFSRIHPEDFDRQFRFNRKVWNFYGDTSYGDSKRVDTDPTGALAGCVINGYLYLRKFSKAKVPSEDLPEWLEKFAFENGNTGDSTFKIEARASGPTVLGMLRKRKSKIKFKPYVYPSGKGTSANASKPERLRACVPALVAGKVILIDGAWCDSFIDQVIGFPQLKHDEEVDVLVMAVLDLIHGKTAKKSGMRLHN